MSATQQISANKYVVIYITVVLYSIDLLKWMSTGIYDNKSE